MEASLAGGRLEDRPGDRPSLQTGDFSIGSVCIYNSEHITWFRFDFSFPETNRSKLYQGIKVVITGYRVYRRSYPYPSPRLEPGQPELASHGAGLVGLRSYMSPCIPTGVL